MATFERPPDVMALCSPTVGGDLAIDLPPELMHRLSDLCVEQIHETSLRVHCFYLLQILAKEWLAGIDSTTCSPSSVYDVIAAHCQTLWHRFDDDGSGAKVSPTALLATFRREILRLRVDVFLRRCFRANREVMEGTITDAQASLVSRELSDVADELRQCIRTLLPEHEQGELLQPVKICIKANVLLFGMDSLCL
ncbi:hypothetical protein BC936DRAFT_146638 [Jimgerdemannia flammicorona]|uniref:Uncharacterized protein n=2 Tax=Jimgerdemannia flammicorona TaxID=994334 RepID=A0A433QYN8_9FUNG|nr:hypothetical protein BC936DRAFT_146638 [Jimgerdemannia flammicorona]RUS34892.1 hypothetical protein BC938DRAFT_477921 [Jimgerdemannia flammicorona]